MTCGVKPLAFSDFEELRSPELADGRNCHYKNAAGLRREIAENSAGAVEQAVLNDGLIRPRHGTWMVTRHKVYIISIVDFRLRWRSGT